MKILDENGRTCTKCGVYKVWDQFNKGDGYNEKRPDCKECSRKYARAQYFKQKTADLTN